MSNPLLHASMMSRRILTSLPPCTCRHLSTKPLPSRSSSSSSSAAARISISRHHDASVAFQSWRHAHARFASSSPQRSVASSSSSARFTSSRDAYYAQRNRSLLLYTAAVLVLGVGVTYASVPLYRLFCSATGFGENPFNAH